MSSSLFLLNDLGIGGSERKTVRIVNRLAERGCDVHLAYLGPKDTLLAQVSSRVRILPLRRHGKYSLSAVAKLQRYVSAHAIANLVCVNLYPILYGLPASRFADPPCHCYAAINTTDLPTAKARLSMAVYGPLLGWCEGILFGSTRQRDLWVSRYALDAKRCLSIHNGVEHRRYAPEVLGSLREAERARHRIGSGTVVLGTVGQLRPEKQQSDLLEAASRLIAEGQDIVVMIVGGGPQLQNLRTTAVRLGIADRVVFRGELADVRPALAAFDVFALTSVAVETFSNAALEAMAAGLPVVISEIGGAAEMIRPAVDGFLYPAGDTAVLADILSTLAADKTQRDRLGAEAVRRVALAFSFEAMIDRYEELFRDPS